MTTYSYIGSYVIGIFKDIIGSLKCKMAEIRHLENRHDVIFSAEGGPIWIQFRRLVQNDMSTATRWYVEMETRCIFQYGGSLVEFNGMSSQSHVSNCRVLPLGEFTVTIPHATCRIAGCSHLTKSISWWCHIAGCKNSIRHIENRLSPYFIFFVFNAV